MALLLAVDDPRIFLRSLPNTENDYRRILALDLGTRTGVAIADIPPGGPKGDVTMLLGQWDLSIGDYDSGVMRHLRLKTFLMVTKPDLIVFEDVKYVPSADLVQSRRMNLSAIVARVATAAEFIGGLKITMVQWAEERGIPAHGYSIATIKKAATGKGNSGKEEMIKACNAQFGTAFDPETYHQTGADNIADAAHVLRLGLTEYADGLT